MLNDIIKMYDKEVKQTGFMKHYLTLFSIVEGLETKRSFEFGTGISTKVILQALERTGGTHTSCDIRDIVDTGLAGDFYVKNADKWRYLQKDSQSLTPEEIDIYAPFDFVLHDGSHIPDEVEKDIKKILPFMKRNSILLVHDTFSSNYNDSLLLAARHAFLSLDLNFNEITLPYGYGLSIFKITDSRMKETITPTWVKGK